MVAACNDLKDTLYRSARRQVIVRSVDEAESLSHAASAITLELQRRSARAELARVTDSLSNAFGPAPAPEARTIIDSVHAASRERLSDAVSAYARAQQQQREYEECQVIKQRLRAEAPALLDELVARADEPDIAVRLETIHEAWHWRRAHDWVEKQRAPGLEARLSSELDATTADISSLTSRLAAERAWMSCLQRMSASEVTALQSYRDHIRSVGKGTGKDAERFRQAARMAMREAQSAVLTRLSEFP
ncbi:hypothetical protein [Gordonia amicalis]|uniref:hypothetical protein n=1 Tax=Gordonia amicalis TaxID=89053 RepID=UPI003A7F68FF